MSTGQIITPAPPLTPRPFGLLSTAVVMDDPDPARWLMDGFQYQTDYCGVGYDSVGACATVDVGTLTISVSNTGVATIDANGQPDLDYTVDWGEGAGPVVVDPLDGATNTYTAGNYTVVVEGDGETSGYRATVGITVVNGQVSGPFAGDVDWTKAVTDGIGLAESGAPFVGYHMLSCRMPAGGVDDGPTRAENALRLSESRTVERVVARQLAAHPDAVDVTPTPGTALGLAAGLALLERYAASNYGGVPVIHSPVDVASLLSTDGALRADGTTMRTRLLTPVAVGAGYDALQGPGGDAPAAGEAWLYVTGTPTVRRTAVISSGMVPRLSPADNGFLALAERGYVAGWECITAAVLVEGVA